MKIKQHSKGYTLLEMLVVLGIFAVMTSITVFNYSKFRGETIITNMAYEVALSIREAQIYGVSVRNPNGTATSDSFQYPYGIHFVKDSNVYYLFADSEGASNGVASCPGSSECVTPYTLQRGIVVTSLTKDCVSDSDNRLSLMFRRPNPETIFDNQNDVARAEITISSPEGINRYVLVRGNGQIEVKRESTCS